MKNVMGSGFLLLAVMVLTVIDAPSAYAQRTLAGCRATAESNYTRQISRTNQLEQEALSSLDRIRSVGRRAVQNRNYDTTEERDQALLDYDNETRDLENGIRSNARQVRSSAAEDRRNELQECSDEFTFPVSQNGSGGGSGGGGNGNGSTVTIVTPPPPKTIVTIEEVCTDDTCEQDAG